MIFVFLGSEFCRRLPSDYTSRQAPLLSANGWLLQTPIQDFHLIVIYHARHTNRIPPLDIFLDAEFLYIYTNTAQLVELVDTLVSGTSDRKVVKVRVLYWAL